jgi:hypothetical protein
MLCDMGGMALLSHSLLYGVCDQRLRRLAMQSKPIFTKLNDD